jgi:hypothetical protein
MFSCHLRCCVFETLSPLISLYLVFLVSIIFYSGKVYSLGVKVIPVFCFRLLEYFEVIVQFVLVCFELYCTMFLCAPEIVIPH